LFLEGTTQIDTAAVGQSHVKDRDVDICNVERERVAERTRFGDDGKIVVGFEQFAKTAANDLVVVYEEKSNHVSPIG
jgi:hypothetical protein